MADVIPTQDGTKLSPRYVANDLRHKPHILRTHPLGLTRPDSPASPLGLFALPLRPVREVVTYGRSRQLGSTARVVTGE